MNKLFFNKVSIIGVGLLGASFALSLRQNNLCKTIIGFGRSEDNLKRAKERGIIDDYSLDVRKVCEDADLILLSTPVGAFRDIARMIKDTLKQGGLITDVGSVKGGLVHELESLMPEGAHYIGSHPIAGSDKSGIDEARADLFNNALCIITPTENSDTGALQKIAILWESVGAKVRFMDPHKHDEVYAAISHLPHVIAFSLVNTIGDIDSEYIEYAGQGFKDTTRIALSSPELWRDIVIYNRENLLKFLEIFKAEIEKIDEYLKNNKAEAIRDIYQRARQLR
ncbi:MAG: prephenate dehydrogenase, partial [Thermodesulfovibrionales bacterium]